MPLLTADAIILQSFQFGDTSKILRLLTATHGIQSVIARGALRPRSRYGGVLEPFTEGVATLYLKPGRELQTLTGFELARSQQGLGSDMVRFAGASVIAEIVLRTASEEASRPLFEMVRNSLRSILAADAGALEGVLLAAGWGISGVLGFEPALDDCVTCGRAIDPAEAASFDYMAGGLRCADCAIGSPGRPIPADALATLRRFAHGEPVTPDAPEARAHWRLFSRYLEHHILENGQLKSLAILFDSLERRPCAS
jgi:DNA repair protein RecO (recombination protein O)